MTPGTKILVTTAPNFKGLEGVVIEESKQAPGLYRIRIGKDIITLGNSQIKQI